MLELAILGLLKEQPLHGYELKRRVSEELSFTGAVSFGSLYPALRRLEKSGAITAAEPEYATAAIPPTGSLAGEAAAAMRRIRPTGGRRKKAYRITVHGEALFTEMLNAESVGGTDDDREFALRLAFARHLEATARIAMLERRRDDLRRRLGAARRNGDPVPGPPKIDRYARSLVEHRVRSVELDLAWVEDLIQAEQAMASQGEVSA